MPDRLINALLAKGWTLPVIALRAKISEDRLRNRTLGRRETERLMQVCECEARINIDDLEGEE
jgi:hypothetical protein